MLITFVGGLLEEIVFRVILATAVAGAVWSASRRVVVSQWTGTVVVAVLVGVWHVWMVSDPVSSDARVLTVNLLSNLLYGWTYWRRGLEMSILTHGTLNSTLYLGLPLLH